MTKRDIDYKKMAEEVFRGIPVDLAAHGVVFRKGKTRDDLVAARAKALQPRYGRGKIESELSSLEMFLSDVFKAAPVGKRLTS